MSENAPITPTPEQIESREDLRLSIEELAHLSFSHGLLVGKGLDAAETEHLLNTSKADVADALTTALNLSSSSTHPENPSTKLGFHRQIAEARAEEREACARLVEGDPLGRSGRRWVFLSDVLAVDNRTVLHCDQAAAAIRARAIAERSTASQEGGGGHNRRTSRNSDRTDSPASNIVQPGASPEVPGYVRTETDAYGFWRCPECSCHSYARVDEKKPDGKFGPGPLVRCVHCKRVYSMPEEIAPPCKETLHTAEPAGEEPGRKENLQGADPDPRIDAHPLTCSIQDAISRLERAMTTATNDDLSEPLSEKRFRHADRLLAMRVAIRVLGDQRVELAQPDQVAALRGEVERHRKSREQWRILAHDSAKAADDAARATQAAEARAATLQAKLDEARKALEPFGQPLINGDHLPDEQVIECQTRNEVLRLEVRVSDFRRARQVFAATAPVDTMDGGRDG